MSENTITVLVPTYRRPALLKRAIESILKQSYSDFVIIVSDNNSRDDTEIVLTKLKKSDSRISFYLQERNIGMNENFNFLFSKVRTKYFCMLTDDDYYENSFLHDAMAGFKSSELVKFSILSCPAINESGRFIRNQLDTWPHEGFYHKEEATCLFLNGSHPIFTAIVFRSEVLEDIAFDGKFGNVSDIPLLVKLSIKYDFYMSRKLGLYFVRHADVISNDAKNKCLIVKEKMSLLDEYNNLINGSNLKDNKDIIKIMLKKKIFFLVSINKDFKKEAAYIINTISHPIKYALMLHLYLVNYIFYTKFLSLLKRLMHRKVNF